MSRISAVAAAVAAVLLAAAAPAAAAPALDPEKCAPDLPKRTQCSTLTVPLDRTGAVPGTLKLPVRVVPARGDGPRRGPLILLSGGPGQRGLSPAPYLEAVMSWAPGYDVVEVDQRGTGETALRCKALDGDDRGDGDVSPAQSARRNGRCAEELGPKRRFYTSADSAADLDELRTALGAEQLTLGGTSYGTWVTQVYARLYPQRVAKIVLDSVIGPEGIAGLPLDEYAGARRVLAAQCADGACRGITSDPVGESTRLSARLARRPVRGHLVAPSGRPQRVKVGGPDLPQVLMALYTQGDTDPSLRAGYPAAVTAALAGDPALLLRLLGALGLGSEGGEEPSDPEESSDALYLATTCAEARLPWLATDTPEQRLAKAEAQVAATPADQLAPWGAASALAGPQLSGCLRWPDSPIAARPDAPLPDVPALILNGLVDVRTPMESAEAVGALLPRATLVPIPNQGHSVLAQPCARRALKRFLADRPVEALICADTEPAPELVPVPPASLDDVAPRGTGRRALARRTATAVRLTTRDIGWATRLYGAVRFPGLREGRVTITTLVKDDVTLKVRRYGYVPGMTITGQLQIQPGPMSGTLRVEGPAAATGTLEVRDGVARGRLGGVRVRVRVQRRQAADARTATATPRRAVASALR